MKTSHQDTVSESNVHMDDIQEARLSSINGAPSVSLWDCCIRSKCQGKLPTINPLSVKASLEDVLVVPEAVAAQCTMKFFGCPMGLCVRAVGLITRANGWKGSPRMVDQASDIVP
jgi:hypothetical protein